MRRRPRNSSPIRAGTRSHGGLRALPASPAPGSTPAWRSRMRSRSPGTRVRPRRTPDVGGGRVAGRRSTGQATSWRSKRPSGAQRVARRGARGRRRPRASTRRRLRPPATSPPCRRCRTGTMRSNHARSGSTLSASPCIDRPRRDPHPDGTDLARRRARRRPPTPRDSRPSRPARRPRSASVSITSCSMRVHVRTGPSAVRVGTLTIGIADQLARAVVGDVAAPVGSSRARRPTAAGSTSTWAGSACTPRVNTCGCSSSRRWSSRPRSCNAALQGVRVGVGDPAEPANPEHVLRPTPAGSELGGPVVGGEDLGDPRHEGGGVGPVDGPVVPRQAQQPEGVDGDGLGAVGAGPPRSDAASPRRWTGSPPGAG